VKPGGRYFFTRNGTTIVAISVGKDYVPENGFTVVAAHTDSPCLRIKPVPCITRSDALMLNTQPYGGGLWHTWFDRDLGIAGKIIFRTPEGGLDSKLVVINKPVARIPNLAIHLTPQADREKFGPNLHSHAKAILTMDPALMTAASGNPRFHSALMNLIAAESGISAEAVVEMDLQLIDVQPSTLGGINSEFLYSGRLDNLCSAYQCLRAIIDEAAEASASGRSDPSVKVAMLFDHEEVGSESAQGAGSTLFMDTLRSLHEALVPGAAHGAFMRSLRKSYVVSIDMAHALHPNYTDKHDSSMAPVMNGGLVIKHNCNQRYATSAASATYFRECARLDGVPVQEFSVRSDSGCGTYVDIIMHLSVCAICVTIPYDMI
jgi:aspartyl aminopeptidase